MNLREDINGKTMVNVAQSVEQQTVILWVIGSNPIIHLIFADELKREKELTYEEIK